MSDTGGRRCTSTSEYPGFEFDTGLVFGVGPRFEVTSVRWTLEGMFGCLDQIDPGAPHSSRYLVIYMNGGFFGSWWEPEAEYSCQCPSPCDVVHASEAQWFSAPASAIDQHGISVVSFDATFLCISRFTVKLCHRQSEALATRATTATNHCTRVQSNAHRGTTCPTRPSLVDRRACVHSARQARTLSKQEQFPAPRAWPAGMARLRG